MPQEITINSMYVMLRDEYNQSFAGASYTKSDQYLSRGALERIARGIEK